jgi:NADH-quinone oxidoreductase subunit C
MTDCQQWATALQEKLGSKISSLNLALEECSIEVKPEHLISLCLALRDDPQFQFEMLIDLCGVDYLDYGISEWATTDTTNIGFGRGVEEQKTDIHWTKPRFAVVYHLLSLKHNHRLRVKCFIDGEPPIVPSVIEIWNVANWYEREAFDLFGILFEGHPDLRRILTDYGFIGHPFRKDFPLIGNVEMRYSAKDQRVIYEPVSISPRTLVPKTIREDNRYLGKQNLEGGK